MDLVIHEERKDPWLIRHLHKALILLLATAGVLLSAVLGTYWATFSSRGISLSTADWALFGDYVGGTLNAALAFLALLALALTLRVQMHELRISTAELQNSAKALHDQARHLEQQTFENTFFQMLRIHAEIVSSMDIRTNSSVTASGRDCIKFFYRRLRSKLEAIKRGDYEDPIAGMKSIYSEVFDQFESDLGHYFRHLYRIFKFVHDSSVSDKRKYTGIVRAQLSSDELAMIFFNGLGPHGDKFKMLIEEYSLLENLRSTKVIQWELYSPIYSPSAFGDPS